MSYKSCGSATIVGVAPVIEAPVISPETDANSKSPFATLEFATGSLNWTRQVRELAFVFWEAGVCFTIEETVGRTPSITRAFCPAIEEAPPTAGKASTASFPAASFIVASFSKVKAFVVV